MTTLRALVEGIGVENVCRYVRGEITLVPANTIYEVGEGVNPSGYMHFPTRAEVTAIDVGTGQSQCEGYIDLSPDEGVLSPGHRFVLVPLSPTQQAEVNRHRARGQEVLKSQHGFN